MTYQPNFSHKTHQKRIAKALGFACAVMSETKSQQWSTRYIDKFFGSQSNDLSKYLREKLLICTDEFYRFNSKENKCKEYRLNKEGVRFLREKLKITNYKSYPSVVEIVQTEHNNELASGHFKYTDKSHRYWHSLQRYRSEYRTEILTMNGYLHHYDIVCAAPNLLHQYAQKVPLVVIDGQWRQGPMDLYLFALRRYLQNRQLIRQELAKNLDVDINVAKEIITALFAGATISQRSQSDIYHILNGDIARIEYLKQDTFISELRKDIRIIWEYLRPVLPKRFKKTSKGSVRLLPLNAKQKWMLYFKLERQVIDQVRTYLDMKSIRYFLIHDGWSCDREIDREDLRDYIRNKTGFDLNFDYKKNNK